MHNLTECGCLHGLLPGLTSSIAGFQLVSKHPEEQHSCTGILDNIPTAPRPCWPNTSCCPARTLLVCGGESSKLASGTLEGVVLVKQDVFDDIISSLFLQ